MHQKRLLTFLTAVVLGAVQPVLLAAELGEPVVKSWIGQPLVADIELLPDAGGAVRAYLAHDDVYRGSNLTRSPVLDSLHMSVMRRDGRQFLHITSIKPVEAEYLHLFLDLSEQGRHTIRPATLWLRPEPAVAAPPAPAQVPAPAPAPAPAARQVASRPAPAARPGAPAVRAPDPACMALDYKNAQLSAQIVDLEEKVKALQYAVDMHAAAPRPKPGRASGPQPLQRPVAAPAPLWTYAGIGLGVLALGGAGGWFGWRRSRRARQEHVAEDVVVGD